MTDFSKRLKNSSNSDLLKIIGSSENYQPNAVETARRIVASRQLSNEELESATNEMIVAHERNQHRANAKYAFSTDETSSETAVVNRIITVTSLIFGVIFLGQAINEFGLVRFMATSTAAKWNLTMIIYFLPLILIPVATFLFYNRNKVGWTLLTVFLTYLAVNAAGLFIIAMDMEMEGFHTVDNFFPEISPIIHIAVFLFATGLLLTISREDVRESYRINRTFMVLTTAITLVITVLLSVEGILI